MRKFWKGLAHFLAVLTAFAFISTAVLALILTGMERRLSNPSTYKNVLAGQQVYARLPRILAEQMVMQASYNPCANNPLLCENASPEFMDCALDKLGEERFGILATGTEPLTDADRQAIQVCVESFGPAQETEQDPEGGPPPFIKNLGVGDWETIINMLFPPEQIQAAAEDLLDQFFAYLDGKQEEVVLSLVPIKDRISGQPGLDAVIKVLKSQAPCSPQEYEQMSAILAGQETETVLCAPTNEQLEPLIPLIQFQLVSYAASLPDESVLLDAESGENSSESGPMGTGPLANLRGVLFLMRLSPLLPLSLLLLITLLVIRTPKSWLRWWGIPFLASALTAGLILATASAIFNQLWLSLLAERIPPYLTLGLVTMIQDLVRSLLRGLIGGMTFSALLLGLLGLGMWVGSFFLKKPSEPTPPEEPLPASTNA